MSQMGNEIVKTLEVNGHLYDVYGCWDGDTPEGQYDYYDIHQREDGICVNLGEPFYTVPNEEELAEFLFQELPQWTDSKS